MTKAKDKIVPLPGVAVEVAMARIVRGLSRKQAKDMHEAFRLGFAHALHCVSVDLDSVSPVVDLDEPA